MKSLFVFWSYALYRLFRFYRYLEEYLPGTERKSVSEKISLRESTLKEQLSILEMEFLSSRLRKVPYWAEGHIRLGYLALQHKDLALAWGSAQAARKLAPRAAATDHLFAKCLLSGGRVEEAVEILQRLVQRFPESAEIAEDLAAGCMASGNATKAKLVLEALPESSLSGEAQALLERLRAL